MDLWGVYLRYREVFDANPTTEDLIRVITELDAREATMVLCQINADLRFVPREREQLAKTQQLLAGAFLDDRTIAALKSRFGTAHMADRPVFHVAQILNLIRLAIQHSTGLPGRLDEETIKYRLGTAALMMNDLFMTDDEKQKISEGPNDARIRSLMVQMASMFEIGNTAAITHVVYRSRVMFHHILKDDHVVQRISNQCHGFNFENEFQRIVGISLRRWLFLVFGFYAYLKDYLRGDGQRRLEYLTIIRSKFGAQSLISIEEVNAVLNSVSANFETFRHMLNDKRPADWRFDFVSFRSKPLIEIRPGYCVCSDVGLLIEKMHSGVYWTLNDSLGRKERFDLFSGWGILFEEYVNWFLGGSRLGDSTLFLPAPKWIDGRECFDGLLSRGTRLIAMEYKGGFLNVEARYSGSLDAFEADLDLKIGEGCRQLASKIESLFHRSANTRGKLKDLKTDSVTRVVPVLIVQDQFLRGPFVNWWLNRLFNDTLHREHLRADVAVDPLNVVGIHELESMVESSEVGPFDMFQALQLRCYLDPEMRTDLQNFLLELPGYGKGKSNRIEQILQEQWDELGRYMFGQDAPLQL